ncbi:MAG TPA: glycerol-3-phosphate 1-O-acyltransferase PlsY [Verrucomicrobiae bacterium]|nr:glycerol-3-phosphate 1-O-acyltransferase PlsY [Verrucomicrobiae bacterium]
MSAGPNILAFVIAYFLGSIPTGYLAGRAKGIDIRTVGSKNIGATNVFRILGKGPGIVVLLVDALKGYLGCKLAPALAEVTFVGGARPLTGEWTIIIAGIGAILGHNYTCWLRFKGGKGVATTAGVMIAFAPMALLMALALWLVVFAASRYVSLASIAAAISLPFATWLAGGSGKFIGIAGSVGALAIYKHKANIRRLLDGTENRFGKKSQPSAAETK